jgi:hypothetical protein
VYYQAENIFNSSDSIGALPSGILATTGQETVRLYPNPASEALTLSVSAQMEGTSCTLMDMMGRTIHRQMIEKENTVISLSGLSSGIYILKIGGMSYKVVKE